MGKTREILKYMTGISAGIGIALILNAAIAVFILGVTDLAGWTNLNLKNVLSFSMGLTLLNAFLYTANKVFEYE